MGAGEALCDDVGEYVRTDDGGERYGWLVGERVEGARWGIAVVEPGLELEEFRPSKSGRGCETVDSDGHVGGDVAVSDVETARGCSEVIVGHRGGGGGYELFDERNRLEPVLWRWLADMMGERAVAVVESRTVGLVFHWVVVTVGNGGRRWT